MKFRVFGSALLAVLQFSDQASAVQLETAAPVIDSDAFGDNANWLA